MAKPRYVLEKGNVQYRVVKFYKGEGKVKVQGALTTFETDLEKALNSGYKLIKEKVHE